MSTVLRCGLAIGVWCVVWTFIMGLTGWYKHPVLLNLFWVVVAIEVGLLVVGLRRTAAAGNRYWGQVASGTAMAVVASVVIFAGSLLFTTAVFPSYFADIREMRHAVMQARGMSPAEIAHAEQLTAIVQRPLVNALSGVLGTIVTGFVASLVIGAFCRSRQAPDVTPSAE
jgi:hypothetical protein